MWILSIRRRQIIQLAILGLAVIALNWFTLPYILVQDAINSDLSLLAGHKIAIDAGHGGIDGGASANNLEEKTITLAIATKLAALLKQHGASVVMTRQDDVDYYTRGKGGKRNDLLARVKIVEDAGAEIFVSIHCNAFRGSSKCVGAEVYYNPALPESKLLAETAQLALKDFPPGNKRQPKQDKDIVVLNAKIPGILVETGYLTDKGEAAKLADENYQQRMVEQLGKAFAYHFSHNVGR